MAIYTTYGAVRGCCEHAHKTVRAAAECIAHDRVECAKQGGYTDRLIRECLSRADIVSYDVTHGPGRPYMGDEPSDL